MTKLQKLTILEPKKAINYSEFLDTVRVIRMLYGADSARIYFTENMNIWYNVSTDTSSNSSNGE